MHFPNLPATPQECWDAIRAGNTVHAKMVFDQNVTIEDNNIDLSSGALITDAFNPDTDLTVGKAVCRQFTSRIILDDTIRNIKWKDRFNLYFGVEINGSTVWTDMGYFYGQQPRNTMNVTEMEYVAYDNMLKFDKSTKEFLNQLTYPITIHDLYSQVCSYVGVTGLPLGTYPYNCPIDEYTVELTKNDLKGYSTFREIIEAIAEAYCCYARINFMDNLEFVWFGGSQKDTSSNDVFLTVERTDEFSVFHDDTDSGITWSEFEEDTWDGWSTTTWGEVTRNYTVTNTIEGISLTYNDETWVYPNLQSGESYRMYDIVDNPFMKDDFSTSTYGNWYYNRLHGLGGLLPMTVECTGNWMIEAGDFVYVKIENDTVFMPVFYKTFQFAGVCTDMMEMTGNMFQRVI